MNTTNHSKRRIVFRESLIFLGFCVLTAVMTWPWILNVRDAVSDKGDPYLHTYFMWWGYHQTFHDPLNLFDANIFYPYKDTLAFSENDYGIALLFFPLYFIGFRPLTVLSVATLVAFAFSGYGMFRLTRTLTGSWGGALVSGIVFAFIPYHFQRLPHLPLIFAGWIPLVLEALVLFARRRSWLRAIWLGVAFLMNALTCVVWFTLTLLPFALSALFLLVWWRLWRDRAFWIRGGLALGVAALALLCFFFPYYRAHKVYGFARSAADASTLSALPVHWLAASSRNKLWEGLGGKMAIDELTLFPGLLPPLLAVAGLLLVRPVSRQLRDVKFSKLWLLVPRRWVLISLDVLALTMLLIALLAKGYDGIYLRLFGVELFRSTHPIRPLIFALGIVCLRLLIATPEIVRRIIAEKNSAANVRSNPRPVALLLGLIWTVTGFLGSFGMNFFFHRFLFDLVIFYRSIRAPVRWAMICYVGLSILAGLGAIKVTELVGRWRPLVPRTVIFALLAILILFEQRVAPIEFAHGEVDPDAITLRLKQTPMSAGIVELPAEKDSYAYHRYVLRAADHQRPIITASSSFAPQFVQQIESLTLARPIPDAFFELLESIPTSYLVVHNSLLSPESRSAIESLVARGVAAGRLRFINSYGNLQAPDDLYAIAKIEPKAQTEIPNRIDETRFFVRQQYLDLLHKEPDSSEWDSVAASIDACDGDPSCLLDRRLQAALNLYHSPEFNDSNYFVYSLYKTAFGRPPKYSEWARDINLIRANGEKTELQVAQALVSGAEFLDRYPSSLTNIEYVDRLIRNAGRKVSPTEQQPLINNLKDGKTTRAGILVKVIKDGSMPEAIYNDAFITTSYLNYLKRDPDPVGFNYWLRILKQEPKGENALIRGFIYSPEYRVRFGQP